MTGEARITTLGLQIVHDAVREARENLERMRPIMAQAVEIQKRAEEMSAPIIASMGALYERTRPFLDEIFRSQKSFAAFVESFNEKPTVIERFQPPIQRYPSAHEIAIAVAEKLSAKSAKKHITAAKRPASVPEGGRWDDLRLDLKDNRSVDVFFKKERLGNCDYETLGLVRKNTSRKVRDRQGEFLEKLALASTSNGLFKPTVESMAQEMHISPDVCHQIKRSLVQKLKTAFGISGNPFHRYDSVEGYRPRFELRPVSLLRGSGDLHSSGGYLYEEITEYPDDEY